MNHSPRIDAITMMKSNTFQGIVKYFKFNAINFITHSTANLNLNLHFTPLLISQNLIDCFLTLQRKDD
jgi:hypothetical protein